MKLGEIKDVIEEREEREEREMAKYVVEHDGDHEIAELRKAAERKVTILPPKPQRKGIHHVYVQHAELELCEGVYLYFVEDIDLKVKYKCLPVGCVLVRKDQPDREVIELEKYLSSPYHPFSLSLFFSLPNLSYPFSPFDHFQTCWYSVQWRG